MSLFLDREHDRAEREWDAFADWCERAGFDPDEAAFDAFLDE